jgi:hypothetical protein
LYDRRYCRCGIELLELLFGQTCVDELLERFRVDCAGGELQRLGGCGRECFGVAPIQVRNSRRGLCGQGFLIEFGECCFDGFELSFPRADLLVLTWLNLVRTCAIR